MSEPSETSAPPRSRRAGAFDVRFIIAVLIGVYGLVITIMGIGFTTADEKARVDGLNINLWAGIVMLVFAALFVLWAVLRPLQVPVTAEEHPTTEE